MRYQAVDDNGVTMLGRSDTVLFSNVETFQTWLQSLKLLKFQSRQEIADLNAIILNLGRQIFSKQVENIQMRIYFARCKYVYLQTAINCNQCQ